MSQHPIIVEKFGKRYFYRFTMSQRVQHIILAVSVIVLVLTGMPLKFHDTEWAFFLYRIFGGIKIAPIIHKVAGVILLLLFIYHIFYFVKIILKSQILPLREKGEFSIGKIIMIFLTQPLVPNKKDFFDIIDLMKYLFFITNKRPCGARFTWKEKFDYWAPFWGVVIIGLSGLIMWQKELFSIFMSGAIINFCLIAHSDEALLAALFLFIWHWYNVHYSLAVFPMGTVFVTGYLPEELMVEEHYEHYVEVMKQEGLENEILPPHGGHAHHNYVEGGQPS